MCCGQGLRTRKNTEPNQQTQLKENVLALHQKLGTWMYIYMS